MRCIVKRIALLAAALMIVAVPVLAEEGSIDRRFEQGLTEKNECLLVARTAEIRLILSSRELTGSREKFHEEVTCTPMTS